LLEILLEYRMKPAEALSYVRSALLAGVIVLAAPYAAAQDDYQPEVANFHLDNGLEVVVIPDRRAPVVTHMLWYKVGSADEDPGRSGYAHFVEHLLFKATENYPVGEFSRRVAEVGGRENAFTSFDYTGYFQQVAPEQLETMMHFEADRMVNLALTDDVVLPELDVVIEERVSRVDNNPSALLGEAISATLYQNHPYGVPIIGWMHEIEEMNLDGAMEFYRRFYGPNNAILIVAGDVEVDEVRALAEQTYGQIPPNENIPDRARPSEPPHHASRVVTLRDERVGTPSVSIYWIAPSYAAAEPGEAEALDLLSAVLGEGTRSRIHRSLVVEQGIAASAGAFFRGTSLDPSSFVLYGTPRGDATVEDIEAALLAEIEKIVEEGVEEEELDVIRRRLVRAMIFAQDSQSGMARMFGNALTTGSTVEDVLQWPDRINQVTPEQVRQAAERYLLNRASVTGFLLPTEQEPS
jgi:zinc protease